MAVKNFVILGAGVTGLTLANELLKAGSSVKVLEATNNVGGLARTDVVDDVPFDAGPHLFHSAHSEIIDYWRELVGDSLVEKSFHAGNYQAGKIYDYPINKQTMPEQYEPREIKLIMDQLNSCNPSELASAKNYNEYVSALAGPFLCDKFFTKYPQKLWGLNTQNLSARFAPRRVEIRETRRSFHSGPGRFAGVIEGGCGKLAKMLSQNIKGMGGEISLSAEVVAINYDSLAGKIKKAHIKNGRTVDLENSIVISTLPVTKNASFLGIDTKLYFRSVLTVNIVYHGEEKFPTDYDWLYFDDFSVPFHRIGMQTRFSKQNVLENHHILCCEVVYQDFVSDEEINNIQNSCVELLQKMDFVEKSNIVKVYSNDLGPVYPGYYLGHERELASVNSQLAAYQNLYFLGSLAEYSYSDLQVLTAKSIDLAKDLTAGNALSGSDLAKRKTRLEPAKIIDFGSARISSDTTEPVFLIGEIGLAHNGDVSLCKQMIKKVHEAGFNAAKIQTYSKGRISNKTRTAKYFEESVDQEESISSFLDKIMFDRNDLEELKDYADSLGLIFFSTPFDVPSLNQLDEVGCAGFKISSMDIVNLPLIRSAAKTGKPVILSTGMANLGDIEAAVAVMLEQNNSQVILLHCVSSYPCDMRFANLSRIKKLSDTFDIVAGYSDHTAEVETPALAAVLGARVIEKHVTMDKGLDGPDHSFSLDPNEMLQMVNLVRKSETSIEAKESDIAAAELKTRQQLRRSIYAATDLGPGDILTADAIVIKSPGDGLSAKLYDTVLGCRLVKGISADSPLSWDNLINR